MESKIIELFEEEFMPMTAERDKQWFGVFKAGYQAALSAVPAQNNLPPDWEKNVSRMWQCVRKHDCDIPSDDLDLMREILFKAQQPAQEPVSKPSIEDVQNLVDASESIKKWLVKNVHQWNFSAYDRLHLATMRVKESMPPVKEVTE
jgi:hypothetical protein